MSAAYQDIHKKIIEGCKKGDPRAQYQLYKLYAKAMYNICLRMLNSVEEAEDMLQESFTDAFLKLNSFRYESSFGAWLKRIVINKCINWINRKKVELVFPEYPPDPPVEEEMTDYENIEFEVFKVQEALKKLPDGYRVIFSLYALEGFDHREISEILDISESTSKSQYLRAKLKIRELLENNHNERPVRKFY